MILDSSHEGDLACRHNQPGHKADLVEAQVRHIHFHNHGIIVVWIRLVGLQAV